MKKLALSWTCGVLLLSIAVPAAWGQVETALPSPAPATPSPHTGHANPRAHPMLSPRPTRPVSGPGAELIADHASVLTATEQALELLKDPSKKKDADQAFAKIAKDLEQLAKRSETLVKENTSKAAALEAEAKKKKGALEGETADPAAKRAAIEAEVQARREVTRQGQVVMQLQRSTEREREAIKELQTGAAQGDAAKIKSASAAFGFELYRIATVLNGQ